MADARRAIARVLSVLAVLTLTAVPLSAQTVTGTMQGTVTDRTGAALPGVTVTVRNVDTGLERIVVTDGVGFYNAPFLPVGRYNVEAGLSGFGSMRRQNVRVDLNETVVQDFILDPAISETVTVSADAARVNVSDGEIKQSMRAAEIMSLPQGNQASFLGLASTFGGYQENPSGGQNNPTLSSGSS
ncbi:MAG: carboxypeptidase-like regulatory domain-containing protein, partial [Thermoanaerobaculia bacterium]